MSTTSAGAGCSCACAPACRSHLPNPVIRSHYRTGFIKQYLRGHPILRTAAATNNVTGYGVNKAAPHLPALRHKLSAIDDNYLDIQQDILETLVDRGPRQRRGLAHPRPVRQTHAHAASSITPDNWLCCTLWCASPKSPPPTPSAPANSLRTAPPPWAAPSGSTAWPRCATTSPSSATLGLVERLPRPRRYRLPAEGYSLCLIFLKLFDRLYAPLTAGLLNPTPADATLPGRQAITTRSPLSEPRR